MTRKLWGGLLPLLLLVASGGLPSAPPALAQPVLQGDVNCSGATDSIDALQVLRSVAGLSSSAPCLAEAGDVDCGGTVNSIDALKVLRFVAGLANQAVDGCVAIGDPLTKGPSSLELIAEALDSGEIDQETAHKYRVFTLFADSRLPDEYKGDDRDAGERMDILDAAGGALDSFSPATQAELAPFFKRPDEPGSWITQETVPSQTVAQAPSADVPAVTWTTFAAVGGKAKVWAQDRYPGDAAKAQAIADALTAKIWPETTGLMGKEPKTDAGLPNNGGSDAIDFYLVHAPVDEDGKAWLGVAEAADPKQSCQLSARYLLVDSDEPLGSDTSPGMLQTVTHEFFHAIQFNFPLKAGCWHPAYAWFTEASATWSEDYVYPDAQSEQMYARVLLDDPFSPIDVWEAGGLQQYAAYLLPYYFSRMAHAPGIVREAWVASKDQVDSVHAIGVALAGLNGWDAVWPEVTLYNWNREPVDDYRDVDDLEDGAEPLGGVNEMGSGEVDLSEPFDHLSAEYYHFKFLDEARTVQFKDNGLEAYAHLHVRALVKVDGQWKEPEDWTEERQKFFCRDLPGQNLEELVIIISNSDGETVEDIDPGDAAPTVKAGKETCDAWEGWVKTTMTTSWSVGKASISGVRFEWDPYSENIPGDEYWTTRGTVNWTFEGTSGNCTVSGSGNFSVANHEGSIHLTDSDPNGTILYYGSGYRPFAEPEPKMTFHCPDGDFEQYGNFNFIWLHASVLNLHEVTDDGHLRGTEDEDFGSTTVQTWEWDLAPAR